MNIILTGIGFVIGLILGSLVDCIANRSLGKESFWGRSYCDKCKKTLAAYDLLPVLSYFLLRGKCRYCKKDISKESLIVELLMGVAIAVLFYISVPLDLLSMPYDQIVLTVGEITFKAFIVCILFIVLISDLKKGIIPDRITYPSVLIALVALIILTSYKIYLYYIYLQKSPLGPYLMPPHSDFFYRHTLEIASPLITGTISGVLTGLFFLILILVTRGRGMGGGDMKLGVFLGLVLGFPQILVALMLSFLLGSIVGVGLILIHKKKFGQTIPFGPFLSLGSLIALFWGEKLLSFYLNLKIPGS